MTHNAPAPKAQRLGTLFCTFFKIGLFTFGGGYAMLPVIEDECVEKRGWITQDELMNVTVIAESTPGPVAINCATFTGFKQRGILGAIAATAGVVLPSLIIIYIISVFLDDFLEYTVVANAFRGIKVVVAMLIINAAVKMIKQVYSDGASRPFTITVLCIAAAAVLAINFFSLSFSVFYLILIAGAAGFVFSRISLLKGGKK